MEWIELGELCDLKAGQGAPQSKEDYSDIGIPFIRAGNLEDLTNGKSIEVCDKIKKEVGDKKKLKLQPKDTVVFAKSGMSCLKSYIYRLGMDCYVVNHLACLTVTNKKLNSKYLTYTLNYIKPKGLVNDLSYPSIRLGDISKMKIPVPPINIQKQIVEVLDGAQSLIDNRKKQIKLLDDLIESVFYDMFGDPVRNDKGWKVKKLKEESICIVPARDKPKSFTGSIPWITINDLERSGYTITSKEGLGLTEKEILEVNRKAVPVGCVLMSCVGNLGITSINGVELVINQQIHAFECNDNLNNKYLKHYIPKRIDYLDRVANSTTVKYINKTKCENIPLLLPPISLQNQFAEKVQVIESQKQLLEESQKLLEDNYNSLMQRAFKGQLF